MRLSIFLIFSFFISGAAHASSLSFIYGSQSTAEPLLVQTVNQGKTRIKQNSPAPFLEGALSTAACANTVCIAVGRPHKGWSHALLKTHDAGTHWDYVDLSQTPGLPATLDLDHASCSDSLCVIVSETYNNTSVIVQSTDSGNNWSVAYNNGEVLYSDVDCIDDYCVAVGALNHNYPGFYPVLIQTQDAGRTWTKISLPTQSKGQLYAVDCSPTLCTAVGYVGISPIPGESEGVLILQSIDKGLTWTKMPLTTGEQATSLFQVKCTDSGCVAIGNGLNALVIADNLGKQSYQGFGVPSANRLDAVDCNDQQCFVVGGSYHHKKYKTLLLSNLGSWHLMNTPSSATLGQLNTINCDDKFCFATGSLYDAKTETVSYFMIQNTEGLDWKSVNFQGLKKIDYIAGGVTRSH